METPEFLIWALGYACPIRGWQDGSDPERTERQLRAARAVGDARREGRVFEGLCIAPPLAFRLEESLAVYGGSAAIEGACRGCPANANEQKSAGQLAGCFGILPFSRGADYIPDWIEQRIGQLGLDAAYAKNFLPTKPHWYGLWINPIKRHEQLLFLQGIFAGEPQFGELMTGIAAALRMQLTLYVRLYPRGRVEPPWWKLAVHCPRCSAAWSDSRSRRCDCCGYVGSPAPDKKRRARGTRPYFPLDRLLGPDAAAAFLVRYEAFRAQRAAMDRA